MGEMSSRRRERAHLHRLAVLGGGFAVAGVLAFTGMTTQLIDAGIYLDLRAIAFLNRFAHRSRIVDTLIWEIWTTAALQGGVVVALVWGAWFSRSAEFGGRPKREPMMSSFIGMYLCLLVTLALRAALPFRLRPANDSSIAHHMPYLPDGTYYVHHATSFPSGHAAVLFSLAVGLWLVSRRLGLLAALHSLFVVCLPRLYFGRHFATDILAGAALAAAIVPSVNTILCGSSLIRRLLDWVDTRPAVFYGVMFFCSLEVATDFTVSKTILHFAGLLAHMDVARIVMSPFAIPTS
jgi:undecaprenyl-diphosphatase